MTDDANEYYDVWQFFLDGTHERVRQHVSAEEAVTTAISYATRPVAQMGIIRRVIVTDSGDFCVLEWMYGAGFTYPPEARAKWQEVLSRQSESPSPS